MTISKHAKYRRKQRKYALSLLGMRCVKCGYEDIRALHIDHINPVLRKSNKDKKHKDTATDVLNAYKRGLSLENEFQVLCANCHYIKTFYEKKEHLKRFDETVRFVENNQMDFFE